LVDNAGIPSTTRFSAIGILRGCANKLLLTSQNIKINDGGLIKFNLKHEDNIIDYSSRVIMYALEIGNAIDIKTKLKERVDFEINE
jgi:hypothetical protein